MGKKCKVSKKYTFDNNTKRVKPMNKKCDGFYCKNIAMY